MTRFSTLNILVRSMLLTAFAILASANAQRVAKPPELPDVVMTIRYTGFTTPRFMAGGLGDFMRSKPDFVGKLPVADRRELASIFSDHSRTIRYEPRANVRMVIQIGRKVEYVVGPDGGVWTHAGKFELSPGSFLRLYQLADQFVEEPELKRHHRQIKPTR